MEAEEKDEEEEEHEEEEEEEAERNETARKDQFSSLIDDQSVSRLSFTPVKLQNYIDIINKHMNDRAARSANSYYLTSKYSVKMVNGIERLVKKNQPHKYFVSTTELFNIIKAAHHACGHGGQRRTRYAIKSRNLANVTSRQINAYLSLCVVCMKKRRTSSNQRSSMRTICPIISSAFGERAQIDLIDLSSFPSTRSNYRYVLTYQDHLTKFVQLRPLISKTASVVTERLLEIFTCLGCPSILQSDNGLEFALNERVLKQIWPELKVVTGRPRHPQTQGSVERANGDIVSMLRCWLKDNNAVDWAQGLGYVQLMKNSAFNRTIGCSPYKAVFGHDQRMNISAYTPPIRDLLGEEDEEEEEEDVVMNDDDDISASTSSSSHHPPPPPPSPPPSEKMQQRIDDVIECREISAKNLKKAADRMSKRTTNEAVILLSPGTPVLIPIPSVDRAKLAFPNLIGVIYDFNDKINKYKVITTHGILRDAFSPHQLQQCSSKNLVLDSNSMSMDSTKEISVRTASRLESFMFVGCKCSGKCANKVCFCIRVNKKCNPLICKHKHESSCINISLKDKIDTRKSKA